MGLEQSVNNILSSNPKVKKIVKRLYQLGMYAISPKIKYEGDIIQISPDDKYEYFFGYYDKSPWDAKEKNMIFLRVESSLIDTSPGTEAEIIMYNFENKSFSVLGTTSAWNVQQGAMLQWLGPSYDRYIIYNNYLNGKFVSVILDTIANKKSILSLPVYSVSNDGKFALSLDFERLHELRPGYGYSQNSNKEIVKIPQSSAIKLINLDNGITEELINYEELYKFETRPEMENAYHKVNHIMIGPDNKRFMFLHRWIKDEKTYSRLITADIESVELYNLSDDDMVSHSFWLDSRHIISYLNKEKEGNGYYILEDKTQKYKQVMNEISNFGDGHPSLSPDGRKIITDTYPDRARMQHLVLYDYENGKVSDGREVGKVFAPFKYDNELRCDLHPKWDRKGEKISIDATFDGKRKVYIVHLGEEI